MHLNKQKPTTAIHLCTHKRLPVGSMDFEFKQSFESPPTFLSIVFNRVFLSGNRSLEIFASYYARVSHGRLIQGDRVVGQKVLKDKRPGVCVCVCLNDSRNTSDDDEYDFD